MGPQVLIIQRPFKDKDLSSASRYGRLEYIFDNPRFQASTQPGVAQRFIEESLNGFDPETDYILHLGGDWVGALLVGAALRNRYPGKSIRALRWERERNTSGERLEGHGFYTPVMMRL